MECVLEGGRLVTVSKSKSQSASLPHDRCMRGSAQKAQEYNVTHGVAEDYLRGKAWSNASFGIHRGPRSHGAPKGQHKGGQPVRSQNASSVFLETFHQYFSVMAMNHLINAGIFFKGLIWR